MGGERKALWHHPRRLSLIHICVGRGFGHPQLEQGMASLVLAGLAADVAGELLDWTEGGGAEGRSGDPSQFGGLK